MLIISFAKLIFCVIYRSCRMSLAKPQMRGLLAKRLRFHLPLAFGLALIAAASFKVSWSMFWTLVQSVLSYYLFSYHKIAKLILLRQCVEH